MLRDLFIVGSSRVVCFPVNRPMSTRRALGRRPRVPCREGPRALRCLRGGGGGLAPSLAPRGGSSGPTRPHEMARLASTIPPDRFFLELALPGRLSGWTELRDGTPVRAFGRPHSPPPQRHSRRGAVSTDGTNGRRAVPGALPASPGSHHVVQLHVTPFPSPPSAHPRAHPGPRRGSCGGSPVPCWPRPGCHGRSAGTSPS